MEERIEDRCEALEKGTNGHLTRLFPSHFLRFLRLRLSVLSVVSLNAAGGDKVVATGGIPLGLLPRVEGGGGGGVVLKWCI